MGMINFVLFKFFYKMRMYNGFIFGGSFIVFSGLGMKWNGKGGEFLYDVFIMMVEFVFSMSYIINKRFFVGVGLRGFYVIGSFNNIVYVFLEGVLVLSVE